MTLMEKNEFYEIINPILNSSEFQKRKNYKHHGKISVYDHSLRVSKVAYILAKKLNKDYKSAAIAGLLHDFYYKDWQDKIEKEKFFKKHGFTHANEALLNSRTYFPELLNERIENAILRHMFPLNKIPPKYLVTITRTFATSFLDNILSIGAPAVPEGSPSSLAFSIIPSDVITLYA